MKKTHLIAIIALLGLIGTNVYQCERNARRAQEIAKYEQNLAAAKDSIHYYQLQNGEHAAAQQAWLLSEKEMLEQLNMSKSEIADLKKKIGKPTEITKIVTITKVDTLKLTETKPIYIGDGKIDAPFAFKDEWLDLEGKTSIDSCTSKTTLYKLEMSTPLTVGMTKDNKFFAATPNPYVTISSINSVQLEQKKQSHWGIGINVGPGVYYDFIKKDVGVGIGAQIGINYKF